MIEFISFTLNLYVKKSNFTPYLNFSHSYQKSDSNSFNKYIIAENIVDEIYKKEALHFCDSLKLENIRNYFLSNLIYFIL